MNTTYSPELVAPAIASLTAAQLRNLVKNEMFGQWLEARISSTSQEEQREPDSEASSEAAMMAGNAEYEATQLLATLSEEEQEKAAEQAFVEVGNSARAEILALMPV